MSTPAERDSDKEKEKEEARARLELWSDSVKREQPTLKNLTNEYLKEGRTADAARDEFFRGLRLQFNTHFKMVNKSDVEKYIAKVESDAQYYRDQFDKDITSLQGRLEDNISAHNYKSGFNHNRPYCWKNYDEKQIKEAWELEIARLKKQAEEVYTSFQEKLKEFKNSSNGLLFPSNNTCLSAISTLESTYRDFYTRFVHEPVRCWSPYPTACMHALASRRNFMRDIASYNLGDDDVVEQHRKNQPKQPMTPSFTQQAQQQNEKHVGSSTVDQASAVSQSTTTTSAVNKA